MLFCADIRLKRGLFWDKECNSLMKCLTILDFRKEFYYARYGMGYYRFFDPTMILVLIGVVLSMAASAKVQSTFAKYSRVRSMTG